MCFLSLVLAGSNAPSPNCQVGFGGWVYFMGFPELNGGLIVLWSVVVVVDLSLNP
jgi:hypothetical protein